MIKLEDKLYTSTEVAEILGVSLRSVYRYIDDDKLQAEVKTATGRHRFTKQNIVDFLYPNGETETKKPIKDVKEPKSDSKKDENLPIETDEVEIEAEVKVSDEVVKEDNAEEEAVDWLAKFREAAKKFEEEALKTEPEPIVEPEPEPEPHIIEEEVAENETPTESVTGLNNKEEAVEDEESISMVYYRSRLGGLKDIAQSLDKNARNSDIDYVFTMQAGLSLYSPIKPFSLLHAYVRSQDKEFFERILMLTPSDEENSQLCLLISDDSSLYDDAQELHGLRVVSKERLSADIKELDPELMKEAESILK